MFLTRITQAGSLSFLYDFFQYYLLFHGKQRAIKGSLNTPPHFI